MVLVEKVKGYYKAAKESAAVREINKFIASPWAIGALAALTVLAFMFSLELVLYTVAILYAVYVGLFGEDFAPLMPLFVFCYIAPSKSNNPGKAEGGLFYGASGIYIICIAAVALVVLLSRIGLDRSMGYKRMFTQKRALLIGMLVLGGAYFLSGIGSKTYFEFVKGNLVFAFLQFVSIILLYFILSATVRWDKFNTEYFVWIAIAMGAVVSLEVIWIYITEGVITNGSINRSLIYSGWGVYNNMGALISMSIPFAFYFACKKKRSSVYLVLGCLLTLGVILSCSRGSMVGAVPAFLIAYVYTFFKCENKKEFRIASLVLLGVLVVVGIIFHEEIGKIFEKVPNIADINNGNITFNDSNRFDVYLNGLKAFAEDPIFGQTFYPVDYDLAQFSEVDKFSSFFPPRWHNTIVQLLATCGIVGLLAYAYHRYETVKLFIKKRTVTNVYIGIAILSLLVMSLLDCHFFNVGPVLFYSMALAVMEFGKENEPAAVAEAEEQSEA